MDYLQAWKYSIINPNYKRKKSKGKRRMAKKERMQDGFLTGVAYFASVHSPKNSFNQLKYVIQLQLDTPEELAKAKKYNLNVKPASKHVPGDHVEIKRVVKGPQTKAPKVIDALNVDLPKDRLIGNGSRVKVKFGMYDNTKGKMGSYLDTVKVLKLVEYKPMSEEAQDFYEVDGEGMEMPTEAGSDDNEYVADEPVKKTPVRTAVKVTSKITDDEIPF
jgi:hypothetical protein